MKRPRRSLESARTFGACTLLAAMTVASGSSAQDAPTPVTRFFDEAPEAHVAARLLGPTDARTEPTDAGQLVAQLPLGAVVTRIAAHGDAVLVELDDPENGNRRMGWVPRQALEPRPAPPPPDPNAPVIVHIDGPAGVTLEQRAEKGWREVCRAPCDVRLPPDAQYRTHGNGLRVSRTFMLASHDGRVLLHVDPASTDPLTAGLSLLGVGGVMLVGGFVAVVGIAIAHLGVDEGAGAQAAMAAAGIVAGVGAAMALAGGAVAATRGTTTVRQALPPTWARLPTWNPDLERAPSSGTAFVVPFLSGSF